jgi:hypothetical protein
MLIFVVFASQLIFHFFLWPRVGHARSAEFKSQPEGEAESSYLVEWTSLSYTPLTEFRLEVRQEGGQWVQHTLPATEEMTKAFILN